MKVISLLTLCLALLIVSPLAKSEVVVIVHPSNTADINKAQISRIFLGKKKSFSSGGQAVPITQNESIASTKEFNSKVLNKSGSQLKAYWSKLVFTGKGTPPKAVASDAEMIALVSANPNLIGYIDAASLTDSVKVVGKF